MAANTPAIMPSVVRSENAFGPATEGTTAFG